MGRRPAGGCAAATGNGQIRRVDEGAGAAAAVAGRPTSPRSTGVGVIFDNKAIRVVADGPKARIEDVDDVLDIHHIFDIRRINAVSARPGALRRELHRSVGGCRSSRLPKGELGSYHEMRSG
jgi:hypothetical protein